MIQDFQGKTAVLTGAGSGFGLECARIGAARGMNLVLVDVQPDALARAEAEMQAMLKRNFDKVANVKPPASRSDSSEKFVVATGFRGRRDELEEDPEA